MLDENGRPFTAHAVGDVPLVLVSDRHKSKQLRQGGILADIAPTMLKMMDLPVPKEMTGESLIID